MIKVVDQAHTRSDTTSLTHIAATTPYTTTTTDGQTCGRTTTAVLRPSNPTTDNHKHPRPFLFSSTNHSQAKTGTMGAHDQVLKEMPYRRAPFLPNRCNHTVETFSRLGGGSLPLEPVVLRESHLCWKARTLRLLFLVRYPHPVS